MAPRLSAVLALLLVLGLAPGCFVFEELQSGQETMDRLSEQGSGSESEASSGGAASSEDGKKEKDSTSWWSNARTLTPGGGSDGSAEDEGGASKESAVVRCRLSDGTRFMRRDECRGRGGKPQG